MVLTGKEFSNSRTFYCPDRFVEGVLGRLRKMHIKPGIHAQPYIRMKLQKGIRGFPQ